MLFLRRPLHFEIVLVVFTSHGLVAVCMLIVDMLQTFCFRCTSTRLNVLQPLVLPACGHTFSRGSIEALFKLKKRISCPLCNTKQTARKIEGCPPKCAPLSIKAMLRSWYLQCVGSTNLECEPARTLCIAVGTLFARFYVKLRRLRRGTR